MMRGSILVLAALALSACGQQGEGGAVGKGPSQTVRSGATPPPAFAICAGCHTITHGRQSSGPSLAGVWGRKAGSMPGYPFSDALKASNIVWHAKSLDTWLAGPIQMVPGTKMVFGISDPKARKDVVDYLQTLK